MTVLKMFKLSANNSSLHDGKEGVISLMKTLKGERRLP